MEHHQVSILCNFNMYSKFKIQCNAAKKKISRNYLDTKRGVKATCVCLCDLDVIVWWISVRMRDCMVARGTTSPHPFSKKRWMTWPAAPIWRMTSSKADGWVKQPRWAIYSLPAFHPSPSLAQFSLSFFILWIITALPETLFQREQDWFIRHGFRKDSGVCEKILWWNVMMIRILQFFCFHKALITRLTAQEYSSSNI